jgi:hypothetical protein
MAFTLKGKTVGTSYDLSAPQAERSSQNVAGAWQLMLIRGDPADWDVRVNDLGGAAPDNPPIRIAGMDYQRFSGVENN